MLQGIVAYNNGRLMADAKYIAGSVQIPCSESVFCAVVIGCKSLTEKSSFLHKEVNKSCPWRKNHPFDSPTLKIHCSKITLHNKVLHLLSVPR